MILHGEMDEIVPHSQGLKLFEAANQPKRFVTLPDASHNNAHHVAADVMALRPAGISRRTGCRELVSWLHPTDYFGLNIQQLHVKARLLDKI